MRDERVESQVTRTKTSGHDFTDVDHSGQFATFCTDPVPDSCFQAKAAKVNVECFRRRGGMNPGGMKSPASPHCCQEFAASLRGWDFQNPYHLPDGSMATSWDQGSGYQFRIRVNVADDFTQLCRASERIPL